MSLEMETALSYETAHAHSIYNRGEITHSRICGCFNCLQTFKPELIVEWVPERGGREMTAECPYCGCDSVIGDDAGVPITDAIQSIKDVLAEIVDDMDPAMDPLTDALEALDDAIDDIGETIDSLEEEETILDEEAEKDLL